MKGSIQHYPWLGKFLLLIGMFILVEVFFSYLGMYVSHLLFPSADFLHLASNMQDMELVPDSPEVHALKLYQFITAIGRFLLLPFFYYYLCAEPALATMRLNRPFNYRQLILIIPVMVSAAVVIGAVNEWNQHIQLPSFLSGLEQSMRTMETQAQQMSDAFLNTHTISGLLLNILLVGVVAAVSEEILFRGLLQDMFSRWTGHKHLGVWIAAFLFSFIHMQFFGFFPRFFLGALLGYLVLYSGSLWAAIAGHFLNNTLAVILYYLVENGQVQQDPTEQGSWLQALLFLPVFVLFIWQFKRQGQYGS